MAERKKVKHAPETAEARPANSTVGETLRAARLAKGLEYEDISVTIHIRPGQLKAIEENDIESLPGMTYAVGFVRSYANFLGLNGAEIVHHFKAEQGHNAAHNKLAFPEPIVESRTPDPMMVGVGAFLAVVILVVWTIYSNLHNSNKTAEQVPPAPPEVASIAPAPPVTSSTAPGPDANVPALTAPATTTTITPVTPAMTDATAAPASTPAAATPIAPAPAATPAAPAAAAAAPAKAAETAVTAPGAAVKTPAPANAPVATANANDQEDQAPAEEASTPKTDDKKADDGVINIKKGKSRITLKAVQDGWVQVIDDKGDVIYKKVLRKGEVYSVPDQAGLSLDTANAGGLSVLVDGKPVSALGGPGEIVRGVVLDPKELKARRKPATSWGGNFRE